jgi:hypothetical protein
VLNKICFEVLTSSSLVCFPVFSCHVFCFVVILKLSVWQVVFLTFLSYKNHGDHLRKANDERHITTNIGVLQQLVKMVQMIFTHPSFTCYFVTLGGLMVNVLAAGPNARGLNPDRGRWIFMPIEICSATFFRGEVKPSVPYCRILRHVKNPTGTKINT